jgi:hypothetical protein
MAANTRPDLTAVAATAALRVGIIDSDISHSSLPLRAVKKFCATSTSGEQALHGARIAELFNDANVALEICAAQVFDQRLSCSPGQVAEAIHWLIEQDVRLINMSFGLRADRSVLRQACAAALDAGICLVAASPAQGDPVYPAAYPGVLRATGDARCHPEQIVWLDSAQADFGGYPGDRGTGFVGASAGCAAVCVALAKLAVDLPQMTAAELVRALADRADYRGPERRAPESGVVAS